MVRYLSYFKLENKILLIYFELHFIRMGTHPSAPSIVDSSGVFLLDWLKDKPEVIGNVPSGYPSNNLPFLFKVLSIGKALSIQVYYYLILYILFFYI